MDSIQLIYIALFGRPADPAGLAYFDEQTQGGQDLTAIADLSGTDEYQRRFEGDDDSTVIIEIYQELFGRTPSFAEVQYWVSQMESNFDINDVAVAIAQSAQNEDAAILDAKVAAANQFTAAIEADNEAFAAYRGEQGEAFGRAFLDQIDSSDDVLTDAEVAAQVDTFVETGAVPGVDPDAPTNQVNFTDAVGESLTGTDANDAFNGVVTGGNGNAGTVNIGDTVNGGEGVDTLNLLVAANGSIALPAGFSSSNVEIVNVTYGAGGDIGALNSNTFGGVEQLWQIDNTGAANFQNVTVGEGVTAGFRSTGNSASAVAAAATVTVAAGVTSAAVALDGVATGSTITLAETTAAGLSTVSVSGSFAGTAAVAAVPGNAGLDGLPGTPDDVAPIAAVPAGAGTLTLAAAGTTDIDALNLSITSNGTVAIGALDDLNTLNASTSTGNLTVDLGTPDELTSATFGSGNDTVSVATSALTAAGTLTIDGGAGNDTITVNIDKLDVNAFVEVATAVTITGGAGNDTFDFDGADGNLVAVTSTADLQASLVTVTDFVAANDTLNIADLVAGNDITLQNTVNGAVDGAADLLAAVTAAAGVTVQDDFALFQFGGNTYIYGETGAADGLDAGDTLIQLTGVTIGQLDSATNFVA